MAKYRNRTCVVDGIAFASKKEARRYGVLKAMEQAGQISNLQLQKEFVLIPAHYEPDTIGKRGGIIKGKVSNRMNTHQIQVFYPNLERTILLLPFR